MSLAADILWRLRRPDVRFPKRVVLSTLVYWIVLVHGLVHRCRHCGEWRREKTLNVLPAHPDGEEVIDCSSSGVKSDVPLTSDSLSELSSPRSGEGGFSVVLNSKTRSQWQVAPGRHTTAHLMFICCKYGNGGTNEDLGKYTGRS